SARGDVLTVAPLLGGDAGLDLIDVCATAVPGGLAADGAGDGVTHGLLLRSRCCSASRTGATEPWPHETDYIPPRVCESGVLRHPGTAGTARPNLSPRLRPPLFVHSRGGGLQAVDIRDTVLPPGKTAVGGRV